MPVATPSQKPRKPFPAWRLPNGIIKARNEDLERSIESCEHWEWFGGGSVFAGVIAAVAIAWYHPPYDSFLEQWGSVIADGLVAIGVALEIKFGQMAGLRQDELRRRSDEKAAEATERAAEANARAAEAHVELARLGKKITPRVITVDGEAKVIKALKSFPGVPFWVKADPAAEYEFVNRLVVVLERAGWSWMEHVVTPITLPMGDWGGEEFPEDAISGVQVRFNALCSAEWRDAAMALGFVLTEVIGKSVGVLNDPPNLPHSCSPAAIHIEVYRKL
jgi:hypothetical protein